MIWLDLVENGIRRCRGNMSRRGRTLAGLVRVYFGLLSHFEALPSMLDARLPLVCLQIIGSQSLARVSNWPVELEFLTWDAA